MTTLTVWNRQHLKQCNEDRSSTVQIVLFGFMFLWLVGCTIIGKHYDTPLDDTEIELLVGKVTYANTLDQLGPPAKVSALGDGLVFLYEHAIIAEKQLGISLEIKEAPWLGWFKYTSAWANSKRQALLLVFDGQGILRNQRLFSWDENLGGGSGVQLFIAVSNLVDTSPYEDGIGPHQWGISLLRPLPQTLNIHQSLDTGTGGLELQATPAKVGQHTLEMR